MGNYSIRELEQLSGIKAHTIRIWEKRYRLISPRRTKTNIRSYSDDDLKKIINVSVLNGHGFKISKIVHLTDTDIQQKVRELADTKDNTRHYIEQLIVAMVDLEEEPFNRILKKLTRKNGFENTVLNVLYPFLEKIGVLWQTDSITPAQEHFISNLIRQKLIVAIDALPLASPRAKRVVLFLPENELHELGLLFSCYLAKKLGYTTYYLGQTVPYPSLKAICLDHKPDVMVTSFAVRSLPKAMQAYFKTLVADFSHVPILATGRGSSKLKHAPNLTVLATATALRDHLARLKK